MGYDVAFFTEAGKQRGMGHLIRTYSIYSYYKTLQYSVEFYLDSDLNYDYKFNDIKYINWDTYKISKHYDIIFIDSYIVPLESYIYFKKYSTLLVVIDDFYRLQYPNNSVILNIAPDSKQLFHNNDNNYKYLLGLEYMPLRTSLINIKKTDIQKEEYVFIMLGGNDIKNLNQIVLNYLDKNIKKVIVHNKNTKLKIDENTIVLTNVTDEVLLQYMAKAKYAISSASMSLYELNFLQIPTIAIAVANNQLKGITQFRKYNILSDYIEFNNLQYLNTKLKHLPSIQKSVIGKNGLQNIEQSIKRYLQ